MSLRRYEMLEVDTIELILLEGIRVLWKLTGKDSSAKTSCFPLQSNLNFVELIDLPEKHIWSSVYTIWCINTFCESALSKTFVKSKHWFSVKWLYAIVSGDTPFCTCLWTLLTLVIFCLKQKTIFFLTGSLLFWIFWHTTCIRVLLHHQTRCVFQILHYISLHSKSSQRAVVGWIISGLSRSPLLWRYLFLG